MRKRKWWKRIAAAAMAVCLGLAGTAGEMVLNPESQAVYAATTITEQDIYKYCPEYLQNEAYAGYMQKVESVI